MATEFQDKNCFEFDKLMAAARKDDQGKETWVKPLGEIDIDVDFDRDSGAWMYNLVLESGGELKRARLGSFAFGQLCRRLKSPSRYILSLPGSVAKQNLDFFKRELKDKDVALKVKHKADKNGVPFTKVRGIVGPSTPLFRNSTVLETIRPMVERHDMRIWKAHFRDHDFHAKFIWGDDINIGTMMNPDNINVGVHIRNSEVGACALEIHMMVFRLVCTNGLIHEIEGAPLYRRKAYNISRDDLKAEFENALHTLENRIPLLIGNLQDARSIEVKEPYKVISRVGKAYGFGKAELLAITEEFNRGMATGEYDATKAGIVNVLTRVAQNYDQTKRVMFETAAGRLLHNEEILVEPVKKADKVEQVRTDEED